MFAHPAAGFPGGAVPPPPPPGPVHASGVRLGGPGRDHLAGVIVPARPAGAFGPGQTIRASLECPCGFAALAHGRVGVRVPLRATATARPGLSLSKYVQFTRSDTLHALLGVVPAFILVASGHITVGIACAIGLLPTSLLGIAPTRKRRLIYGVVGCLFGVGVLLGSLIATWHGVYLTAAIFLVVCYVATVLASRRPVGGLLLSIVVPSLAVGTGYARSDAFGLMLAFMLGSVWSSVVMLRWPEFEPDPQVAVRLKALQPEHVKTYGLLLGMTAATAILAGHVTHNPYPGWIATAAMLIMRPVQEMTGWRGVGRAISTIAGTLLVVFTINQELGHLATAIVVCVIATLTIGARTSKLYITPFGTAFLILTIGLYGVDEAANISRVGWYRIVNNVVGALIALFFGLLVPWVLKRARAEEAGFEVPSAP